MVACQLPSLLDSTQGLFPWALWLFCLILLIDTVLLSTWLYCLMTEVICCIWHIFDNELTTFMQMALLDCPLSGFPISPCKKHFKSYYCQLSEPWPAFRGVITWSLGYNFGLGQGGTINGSRWHIQSQPRANPVLAKTHREDSITCLV